MKIFCKNATVLSLIFLCLQFTPCYAANEAFLGTYSGEIRIVSEEGNVSYKDFLLTFGSDDTYTGDGIYIPIPNDKAFYIHEGVDGNGNLVFSSIIIRDRSVFLINIGQFWVDPLHGWADLIEFAFTGNFKTIQLKGFEIDEDPNPLENTGGEIRGVLQRVN